jgi:adenylate kinase
VRLVPERVRRRACFKSVLHLPQISTGDIFRALKHSETPLAQEVRDIMQRGQLVPDELTIQLVKERTSQPDAQNGYILDGFPRTDRTGAEFRAAGC